MQSGPQRRGPSVTASRQSPGSGSLDASMDTATLQTRTFRIPDIRVYVPENRPRLLVAALTVLIAHRQAGYPAKGISLPSFEVWSRPARDPLTGLGLPDPVESQVREADDESDARENAFRLLKQRADAMGNSSFLAVEVGEGRYGDNGDVSALTYGRGNSFETRHAGGVEVRRARGRRIYLRVSGERVDDSGGRLIFLIRPRRYNPPTSELMGEFP